MAVWRLITHHSDPERLLAWTIQNSRIAIGWCALGDLRTYPSEAKIKAKALVTFPTLPNRFFSGHQLWAFLHEVQKGDLVILSARGRARVAEVTGDYMFEPTHGDASPYAHQRPVRFLAMDPDELWVKSGRTAPGENQRWAFVRCTRDPRQTS